MKISVIGCGYLGAVHAACLASLGHNVVGLDIDSEKVRKLAAGVAPFYEPEFPELLAHNVRAGRLTFTTDPTGIAGSDIYFIAVGTPQSADGLGADLSYVEAAVDTIIAAKPEGAVVVGKSTVPVGTAKELNARLTAYGASLIWNPEFLREGTAVKDTLHPDRIVYGLAVEDDPARDVLDQLYAPLLAEGIPLVVTDFSTAELVKVAANSFLATKISFINAMSELCEATGGNVAQLSEAIGYDERIGPKFLNAGIGFGGGCLPKDIRAFAARAQELGVDSAARFLNHVDAINMSRRERVVEHVTQRIEKGSKIAVLGAAFKANSDDVRDSPALGVAQKLSRQGYDVMIYDPRAMGNIRRMHPDLKTAASAVEAASGAAMTLVLTEWEEFKDLAPVDVGHVVASKVILDGRNILDPHVWREAGWEFVGMGR